MSHKTHVDSRLGSDDVVSDLKTSPWASLVADEANSAESLTIGIANGSRLASDRATIDALTASLASELKQRSDCSRCLLIRSEITSESQDQRISVATRRIPVAQRSPIGEWFEVGLPCDQAGISREAEARRLRAWLPVWKESFNLIVMDLGPVHETSSRLLGQLCDGCYLLLGPAACGSEEWIMQQIAWHHRFGSIICGSLLASREVA